MIKSLKQLAPASIKELTRRWVHKALIERKLRKTTPVIVYQMGKVGSKSICHSLSAQYPGLVLHTHSFCLTHPNPMVRRLYKSAILKKKPLNIISLTREPVARNISAFFQNFERDTGVPFCKAAFSLDELKTIFLLNYNHEIPIKWFDEHILKNFGIDVYTTPFPSNLWC